MAGAAQRGAARWDGDPRPVGQRGEQFPRGRAHPGPAPAADPGGGLGGERLIPDRGHRRRVTAALPKHHLQACQPGRRVQRLRAGRQQRRGGQAQLVADQLLRRGRTGDHLRAAPPRLTQVRPQPLQLLRHIAMQLPRQPRDQHAVPLIGLIPGQVLLLPRDMADQRLHAHHRQPPLRAQLLRHHPPRPGRLTRHRQPRKPRRPRLLHRPVQHGPQAMHRYPRRPARQHQPVCASHHQRLLLLTQIQPRDRVRRRHQRPQPGLPRIPPQVTPRDPISPTLAHRTSSCCCAWDTKPALSHQEDVPLPPAPASNKSLPGNVLLLRRIRAIWSRGSSVIMETGLPARPGPARHAAALERPGAALSGRGRPLLATRSHGTR